MRSKPTFAAIQQALQDGVLDGRMSVEAFSARLYCSPSTLHRRLRRRGTTFAAERSAVRVARAFELLNDGHALSISAARVGVRPDYLCVMMRRWYGLTPRRIQQIVRLAQELRRQPQTRKELAQFGRNDARLQVLLDPIGASHPLAGWAKELVVLGDHPEYGEPEFLTGLREVEGRLRLRRQHQADAERVAGLSEEECAMPVDVEYLLLKVEHAQQHMRWRSRQLRTARQSGYARTKSMSGER